MSAHYRGILFIEGTKHEDDTVEDLNIMLQENLGVACASPMIFKREDSNLEHGYALRIDIDRELSGIDPLGQLIEQIGRLDGVVAVMWVKIAHLCGPLEFFFNSNLPVSLGNRMADSFTKRYIEALSVKRI